MKADTARLQAGFDSIMANPEEWNQRVWGRRDARHVTPTLTGLEVSNLGSAPCGTTFCLAGRLLANERVNGMWLGTELDLIPSFSAYGPLSPGHAAMNLVGLREQEASALFEATNDLRTLWAIGTAITDGALVVPDSIAGPERCFGLQVDRARELIRAA